MTMGYSPLPIHRYIETHAVDQPEAIAIGFLGQQLSYEALNCRANQLSHYLIKQGVGAEERVVVCLRPSLEVGVSLLAILKAGGVYVPIDPNDPTERLETILQDVRPALILTDSTLSTNLPNIKRARIFCLDRDWEEVQILPTTNPKIDIDLEQTAYLVYTSGTTGKPKGVMASHKNLIHYILSAHDRYNFSERDVMPAVARFTFSISLFELLTPLVSGGQLLILERDQVLNYKRMVQVLGQVTIIHTSPSLWRKLLAYILANDLNDGRFDHLRHVSAGGDAVPGDLLETIKNVFPQAEVFVIYGCTEISCMGCTYPALRGRSTTRTWLGKPFTHVEIRLFDPEGGSPEGGEGEIYIGGAGVAKGYLNLAKLTSEKFIIVDGRRFYRTGDLGRFDDGDLQILGRVDFQIQLRGIRIEPGEIEAHLRQTPGIRDGVVVAREWGNSDKSLIAYIVLDETGAGDMGRIRQHLKAKLPDYMVPAAFIVLDAIPLNSNGKIDRQALPAPTFENAVAFTSIVPPRNNVEKELVEIWEKTLGISPIGVQNSFFDLGGDSLQAIQILMQIEERWNKTLPITILLEAKSIEALAEVVSAEKLLTAPATGCSDVVPLRVGGNKAPLFCLQGVLLYQPIAECLDTDHPVDAVFLQDEVELIKTQNYDAANSVFATISRLAARYLQAVRSVQPHGPYYFCGSSFAGLIAFEMAHQLQAVGEETALVALFDSMMIRKITLQRRLQCHWNLFREQGLSYPYKKIRRRLLGVWRKLTGSTAKPTEHPFPLAEAMLGVSAAAQENILDHVSALAARSYHPRRYSGKLVLFRATDQSFFNEDSPDLGWKAVASGDLEIHDIPGNHLGILKGLSACILARRLQNYLP